MTIISMDQFTQRNVAINADDVIAAWPCPGESSLLGVNMELHISTVTDEAATGVVAYSVDGFILPILDLDGGEEVDTLWDELVPKSDSTYAFEMSDVADPDPPWAPGEQVSEVLTGMVVQKPTRIFKRRTWISAQKMGYTTFDFATNDYFPGDYFSTEVKKTYHVERPSAIMFGFGSPPVADVSNTELLPTGAALEWVLLKHIDDTQKDVMRMLLGLSSEGTGTFGLDEAEAFMESIVSRFGSIDDVGDINTRTWQVITISNCRINVPGTMKTGSIKAD